MERVVRPRGKSCGHPDQGKQRRAERGADQQHDFQDALSILFHPDGSTAASMRRTDDDESEQAGQHGQFPKPGIHAWVLPAVA